MKKDFSFRILHEEAIPNESLSHLLGGVGDIECTFTCTGIYTCNCNTLQECTGNSISGCKTNTCLDKGH